MTTIERVGTMIGQKLARKDFDNGTGRSFNGISDHVADGMDFATYCRMEGVAGWAYSAEFDRLEGPSRLSRSA